MGATRKDRLVQLLEKQTTKDPVDRSTVVSWVVVDDFWAEIIESATAGELETAQGMPTYARPHQVKIYWRPDVGTEMRLRLEDGRVLEILGTAMVGRQRELRMSCTELRHQQP